MNKKKILLNNKILNTNEKEEIQRLDEEISKECADKEYEKLANIVGNLETSAGTTNLTNIWKSMRKVFAKNTRPLPTGVKNIEGKGSVISE